MRGMGLAVIALAMTGAAMPAKATIWLSESGSHAYLSGDFSIGDEEAFDAFLKKPRETRLKVVFLDSLGGSLSAGIKIGRLIRKAGLSTAVRASRARCDSACTLMFAGGVKRYYIGGEGIFEGHSSRGGLGYHPPHMRDPAWTRAYASPEATAVMSAFYREMGQPRAMELVSRAGFTSMYRPSGKTALDLRIATSLGEPTD